MAIQSVNNFQQDDEGGILVFAGLSLAVMLGMAAMVFDMGRMATTQTELQTFADNVALAAAGELDGETDSITRANLAAANLTSGKQTFGQGNNVLAGAVDYSLCYADTLPEDDLAPITCLSDVTDEDQQRLAAYVEVTATPRDVDLPFARVFAVLTGSGAVDNTVSAVAVAGFVSYACDITPLMFCVPGDDWTAAGNVGQSIYLRSGGSGAAWGPGDFGFLDVSEAKDPDGTCKNLNGAQLTACMIAALGNITACFQQNGVDTEPGQKVGIENSIFNTRFDMFNSMMSKYKTDPNYAPGPHVAKGFVASNGNGTCVGQATEVADTMAFPPDSNFPDGRFGNKVWDIDGYIETNHGPTTVTDAQGNTSQVPESYMYQALIDYRYSKPDVSRHDIYKREISLAEKSDSNGKISYNPIFAYVDGDGNYVNTRAENGIAQCSNPNNVVPLDPTSEITTDRRTFTAAAINCDPVKGGTAINGAEKDVPVQEFVKIFLTEPVGESTDTPPNFEFYVEVVGTAEGLGEASLQNGLINHVVQLYR